MFIIKIEAVRTSKYYINVTRCIKGSVEVDGLILRSESEGFSVKCRFWFCLLLMGLLLLILYGLLCMYLICVCV